MKRLLPIFLTALLAAMPAHADLQVNLRKDTVTLNDGTEIECIVLMVTKKAVMVVEADPENKEKTRQRIIPRETVEKIEYGESDGSVAGFQTDTELARKVVQGIGFRNEEKAAKKEEKPATPANPNAVQPLAMGKASKIATEGPAINAAVSKFTARELTDAYFSRFPILKSSAQAMLGADRVPQLIEQAQKGDPLARRQVETFLKLCVQSDTSSLNEKAQQATPSKSAKPPKPARKTPAPAPAANKEKPAAPAAK